VAAKPTPPPALNDTPPGRSSLAPRNVFAVTSVKATIT
jgi:hypothetical protein